MSIAEKLTAIAENQQRVYDAGVKSEYDRFWDDFQDNGNRTNYNCSFVGLGWSDENYNPKYPIVARKGGSYLFWNSQITDTKVPIDIIDSPGSTGSNRFMNTKLVTIRKLIMSENTVNTNMFNSSTALENLTIEGTIGNALSLSSCTKLTHDSLMSVITALKDFVAEGAGTTKTLTLGATNLAKLTEDEKKIATDKGWTLA